MTTATDILEAPSGSNVTRWVGENSLYCVTAHGSFLASRALLSALANPAEGPKIIAALRADADRLRSGGAVLRDRQIAEAAAKRSKNKGGKGGKNVTADDIL